MPVEEEIAKESSKSNMMAALQSGGNLVGNLYTNWSNRKFTEEQNEIERKRQDLIRHEKRKWALEDRDNERAYNSVGQQMQRLKDAGLNPHLVYGHGAKAQVNAMPRSADGPGARTSVPKFDNPMENVNILEMYYAPKIMAEQLKSAQLNNQGKRIDNDRASQDLILKQIDVNAEMNVPGWERIAGKVSRYQKDRVKIGLDMQQADFNNATFKSRTMNEYQKYIGQKIKNTNNQMMADLYRAKLKLLQQDEIRMKLENNLRQAG